jgi:D-glycero-D-manno-heptose 1,7-bisphosphate phosphatase
MPLPKRKAVFLDRDGTINDDPGYLNDPNDIRYLPGALEGLKAFSTEGFELIIVTNQSGIPRGLIQEDKLHLIHQKIQSDMQGKGIKLRDIFYAPYLPESNHPWRKPNPGMLLYGIEKYNIDPSESWMIGDRYSDIEAGNRAYVSTILVHPTATFLPPPPSHESTPTHVVSSLLEAAQLILKI